MIVNKDTNIYVGNTEIIKAYQGSNIIYEKNTLPYTPIEYLKTDGAQYIDTGVLANGIEICFRYTSSFQNEKSLFGARNTGTSGRFSLTTYNNGFHIMPPGYNLISYDTEKHTLTMGAKYNWVATIGNTSYNVTSQQSYCDKYSTYLFAENMFNSARYPGVNVEIYYCKLYMGDTLLRDFIPVLDENNIPCMYDKVSNTYFYNQGSSQFIYG